MWFLASMLLYVLFLYGLRAASQRGKPTIHTAGIWDADPEKRESNFRAAMAAWRSARWR